MTLPCAAMGSNRAIIRIEEKGSSSCVGKRQKRPTKARCGRSSPGQVRRQKPNLDRALEAGISGLIDDAHAAAAKLADDHIGTEVGAGREGHRSAEYTAGLGCFELLRRLWNIHLAEEGLEA